MNIQYAAATERLHSGDVLARGVHHLALTTDDMKGTTDFYVNVLGMPLVHAMKVPPGLGTGPKNRGNPPYEEIRHYFFDMGNDSLMAFFEIPKGSEPKANRNAVGGMQHVAISVTHERFDDILSRLEAHGIANSGPIEQLPGMVGVYFLDPNGIRVEFACQPSQDDDQKNIAGVTQTKDQARAELASLPGADEGWVDGLLASLPD